MSEKAPIELLGNPNGVCGKTVRSAAKSQRKWGATSEGPAKRLLKGLRQRIRREWGKGSRTFPRRTHLVGEKEGDKLMVKAGRFFANMGALWANELDSWGY